MNAPVKYILCAACLCLLAACGDKKTTPTMQGAEKNAPPPVAEQERDIQQRLEAQKKEVDEQQRQAAIRADRAKYAGPVLEVGSRWNALRKSLSYGRVVDIDDTLKRMRTMKAEAEAVEVDSCAAAGRTTLVESMDLIIGVVGKLDKSDGKIDDATQKDIDRANDLQNQAETQLRKCTE